MQTYYVYILTNYSRTTLYIGVTNNLARRTEEHAEGFTKGFTEKYKIKYLVYFEEFNDIREAIDREKRLKAWKRAWKNELVSSSNPKWTDLNVNSF